VAISTFAILTDGFRDPTTYDFDKAGRGLIVTDGYWSGEFGEAQVSSDYREYPIPFLLPETLPPLIPLALQKGEE